MNAFISKRSFLVSVATFGLQSGAVLAQEQVPPVMTTQQQQAIRQQRTQRLATAEAFLVRERPRLQFSDESAFKVTTGSLDNRGNFHFRFRQYYRDLPVVGGEAIVHVSADGQARSVTESTYRNVNVDIRPKLTAKDLPAVLDPLYLPSTARLTTVDYQSKLVIYPVEQEKQSANAREVLRFVLAWMVRASAPPILPKKYVVDANTGEVLASWKDYQEVDYSPVAATGHSLKHGTVSFTAGQKALDGPFDAPFWMIDPSRGNSRVLNLDQKEINGGPTGDLYSGVSPEWGDGNDYTYAMSTWSVTGQTAAADVMYAIRNTWDMLKNVFGRDGLDDNGKAMIGRVHARKEEDKPYGDAMWNGTYANFGDGAESSSESNTHLVIVGHEFGHGVWHYATDYDDHAHTLEGAGLNEGHGDIMGTLAWLYAKGANGEGASIPTLQPTDFMNRMERPEEYEIDGQVGLKFWVANINDSNLEEHVVGCMYGHMFFILVHGAKPSALYPDLYSPVFPNGSAGIGAQKAGQIWYLATTAYLAGTPSFSKMRTAYVDAAADLYGMNSPTYKAVVNAWAAIGYGQPAVDNEQPVVSLITSLDEDEGSLSVTTGASDDTGIQKIDVLVDDQLRHTAYGAFYSGFLDASALYFGNHEIRARASDFVPKTTSTTKSLARKGVADLIQNGRFESGGGNWTEAGAVIYSSDENVAFLGEGSAGLGLTALLSQAVHIPTGATRARFGYRVRVEPGPPFNQAASLCVQIASVGGDLLETLACYPEMTSTSNAISNDYRKETFDVKAYAGRTVLVRFVAVNARVNRFRVDNVWLTVEEPVSATFTVDVDEGEGSVSFRLTSIQGIDAAQIRNVVFVINGTPVNDGFAPYLAVITADEFNKNVTHSAVARLYNFAGSVVREFGPVQFQVKDVNQVIKNPGFEQGPGPLWWLSIGDVSVGQNSAEHQIYISFLGNRAGWFGGKGTAHAASMRQIITLPSNLANARLVYRVRVDSQSKDAGDRFNARIVEHSSGDVLETFTTITGATDTHEPANWNGFRRFSHNLTKYAGKTIRVQFRVEEDNGGTTSFWLDNVGVVVTQTGFTFGQ